MSIIISSLRNREQNLVARRGKNRAGIWILRAAAVIRPTYGSRSAAHKSWPLGNRRGQAGIKPASAVPGGSDRWPQRSALEIGSVSLSLAQYWLSLGSILQVPDRRLKQAKAGTRGFFGFPIALQFIFALQASPFIRIDGFDV
jgi:hypothetical protein